MKQFRPRYVLLLTNFIIVTLFKIVPGLGSVYTFRIYPTIAWLLSPIPNLLPFAVGDLFITISIAWVIIYPIYAIWYKKRKKLPTFLRIAEYLGWVYVWFYAAWGLNYSQPNIYSRLRMRPVEVENSAFRAFAYSYADSLNATYLQASKLSNITKDSAAVKRNPHYATNSTIKLLTQQAILLGYTNLRDMGINRPFNRQAHAKPMLFSRLASMAGITGSMAPFFCEFTLNSDILPHEYPAIYAHEYAHFLGIANEGEANFYSYVTCTSSTDCTIRFSGYYQIFFHVLRNVYDLLGETERKTFISHIRPEIIRLAQSDRQYWLSRHSPIVDSTQNFFYNLYLKGNRVEGGIKSYSGVIGIIMSWNYSLKRRFTTAGLPAARESAGMSRTTTLPAAMMERAPMLTPGHTVTPPPSQQSSPIVIGKHVSTGRRRSS